MKMKLVIVFLVITDKKEVYDCLSCWKKMKLVFVYFELVDGWRVIWISHGNHVLVDIVFFIIYPLRRRALGLLWEEFEAYRLVHLTWEHSGSHLVGRIFPIQVSQAHLGLCFCHSGFLLTQVEFLDSCVSGTLALCLSHRGFLHIGHFF